MNVIIKTQKQLNDLLKEDNLNNCAISIIAGEEMSYNFDFKSKRVGRIDIMRYPESLKYTVYIRNAKAIKINTNVKTKIYNSTGYVIILNNTSEIIDSITNKLFCYEGLFLIKNCKIKSLKVGKLAQLQIVKNTIIKDIDKVFGVIYDLRNRRSIFQFVGYSRRARLLTYDAERDIITTGCFTGTLKKFIKDAKYKGSIYNKYGLLFYLRYVKWKYKISFKNK